MLPSDWVYSPITIPNALSYSRDGKLIALAGSGGLQIWTVATNTLLTCIPTQAGQAYGVAFSPDGKTVALGGCVGSYKSGGPVIELWNITTGKLIRSMHSQTSVVYSISFSADGTLLADGGWGSGNLEVWSIATGNLVASLQTGMSEIDAVAFAPGEMNLAAGGYGVTGSLELWDVPNSRLLKTYSTTGYVIDSISFSPDGARLAAGGVDNDSGAYYNGIAEVWQTLSGKTLATLNTTSINVQNITFSPDGKSIAVAAAPDTRFDTNIEIWDAAAYKQISTLAANANGEVRGLAFAPNGKSLAAFEWETVGYNYTYPVSSVVAWEMPTGVQIAAPAPDPYVSSNTVTFSPNGKSIALGGLQADAPTGGGWLGIWNNTTKQQTANYNSKSKFTISSVAYSPDGSLLAGVSGSGQSEWALEVWDTASGTLTSWIPLGFTNINSIVFLPDNNTVAVCGNLSEVQLVNISTGTLTAIYSTSAANGVNSMSLSPDGTRLAICGSRNLDGYPIGVLEIWDVPSGRWLTGVNTGLYILYQVTYSQDGLQLADAGYRYIADQNIVEPGLEIWDTTGGPFPKTTSLPDTSSPFGSLAFTGDGKSLFAAAGQGIAAVDTATGDILGTFDLGPVAQLSISRTGDQIAYVMNSILHVASIPTFGTAAIASVALASQEVQGGSTSTGIVTLEQAAPAGGIVINLSTNNPAATVLPSVTVAAGATTATFSFTTIGVDKTTPFTITARVGLIKMSTSCAVLPATIGSLQLDDASVVGGNIAVVWVNLTGPAGPSGVLITLKSNSPFASVPATVLIPSYQTDAIVVINTTTVVTQTSAAITAVQGSNFALAKLTVLPPILSYIYLDQFDLTGGASTLGHVVAEGQIQAKGMVVHLSSNSPAVSVPASVTIPAGQTTAEFTITTLAVPNDVTCTLTATSGKVTKTAALTIEAPKLSSLLVNPTSVQGGQPSTGTVTISSPAPSGGILLTLSSNSLAATVPISVTIPAGKVSATFAIATSTVSSTTEATIKATYGTNWALATLSISGP